MKKTLLALAIAGAFVGVAQAQTSITTYGIVDVNVQRTDRDGIKDPIRLGVESGHKNGSRLGFRGVEDLGGGLSAFFTLEAGISPDSGTSGQGGRLFGRGAFVGLRSKDFGEIALGRIPLFSDGTGAYDMTSSIDPWETGFGIAGMSAALGTKANRPNNVALYRSPRIAGFQAGAMYSFQAISDSEVPGGGDKNTTVIGLGGNYSAGPIYAAVTYDIWNAPNIPASASRPKQKNLLVGGWYNFGIAKLHAAYGNQKNEGVRNPFGTLPAGINPDSDAFMVGTTIPVGSAGSHILASYQKRFGDSETVGTTTVEQDLNVWGIGYVHALSRRTFLYATFADSQGKKSLKNTSADANQTTIGINHRF